MNQQFSNLLRFGVYHIRSVNYAATQPTISRPLVSNKFHLPTNAWVCELITQSHNTSCPKRRIFVFALLRMGFRLHPCEADERDVCREKGTVAAWSLSGAFLTCNESVSMSCVPSNKASGHYENTRSTTSVARMKASCNVMSVSNVSLESTPT